MGSESFSDHLKVQTVALCTPDLKLLDERITTLIHIQFLTELSLQCLKWAAALLSRPARVPPEPRHAVTV